MRPVTDCPAARNADLDALEIALRRAEKGCGLDRGRPFPIDVPDFYVLLPVLGYQLVEQAGEVVPNELLHRMVIRDSDRRGVTVTVYNRTPRP